MVGKVHLLLFGHIGSSKEGSRKVERLAGAIVDTVRTPLPFLMPRSHSTLPMLSPGIWFPGWQLYQRVSLILCRDVALAVRGYGQCVATARSAALTERLLREIATLNSRFRRDPHLMHGALATVTAEVERYARGSPLKTAVVAALLATLQNNDDSVRAAAAQALGPAAAGDAAVVAALLAALHRTATTPCDAAAARALGPAAAGDAAVVAALLAALKDGDSSVRAAAAQALGPAAAGDAAMVAALLAALKDGDHSVRAVAARALGPAAAGDAVVVTALLAALQDEASRCDRWRQGAGTGRGGRCGGSRGIARGMKDGNELRASGGGTGAGTGRGGRCGGGRGIARGIEGQ